MNLASFQVQFRSSRGFQSQQDDDEAPEDFTCEVSRELPEVETLILAKGLFGDMLRFRFPSLKTFAKISFPKTKESVKNVEVYIVENDKIAVVLLDEKVVLENEANSLASFLLLSLNPKKLYTVEDKSLSLYVGQAQECQVRKLVDQTTCEDWVKDKISLDFEAPNFITGLAAALVSYSQASQISVSSLVVVKDYQITSENFYQLECVLEGIFGPMKEDQLKLLRTHYKPYLHALRKKSSALFL